MDRVLLCPSMSGRESSPGLSLEGVPDVEDYIRVSFALLGFYDIAWFPGGCRRRSV